MKPDVEENVVSILARKAGINVTDITLDMRLLQDLRLDGDDAVEVILEISKRCGMDVLRFNSSLYFSSEPSLLAIFGLPWHKVEGPKAPMTLTVGQLVEAARAGRLVS